MNATPKAQCRLLPVALLLAVHLLDVNAVRAQDADLSIPAYLASAGLTAQAADLEKLLRVRIGDRMADWPTERVHQHAAFFAYIFAVSGVTAAHLITLEGSGLDVVHAVTADSRPLAEQSLLSDVVVVGEVVDEATEGASDGFAVSTFIRVRRLLKGTAAGDTLIIRQRNASTREREIRPQIGHTYLLLLSNGVYRYQAARARARATGASPPNADVDEGLRFSIYRIYPFEDGRIDWRGLGRIESAHALEEIERVDRLLKGGEQQK